MSDNGGQAMSGKVLRLRRRPQAEVKTVNWLKDHEAEFIQGLGCYAQTGKNRVELLRLYERALALRKRWDGLSRGECFSIVRQCRRQEGDVW